MIDDEQEWIIRSLRIRQEKLKASILKTLLNTPPYLNGIRHSDLSLYVNKLAANATTTEEIRILSALNERFGLGLEI
jgi:hypothetical protein